MDSEGHIRLADFGYAKSNMVNFGYTMTICGTYDYMAPEVLRKNGYSFEADIWSFVSYL